MTYQNVVTQLRGHCGTPEGNWYWGDLVGQLTYSCYVTPSRRHAECSTPTRNWFQNFETKKGAMTEVTAPDQSLLSFSFSSHLLFT